MPGVVTAFIAALCYAFSYIFVRKGQTESDPGDHGLFLVLLVSGITLSAALGVTALRQPNRLVNGRNPELAVLFCVLAGVVGTCFGRMTLYGAIARIGAARGVIIDMLSAMVTLALATSFLGEKFHLANIYGMGVIMLGLSLLATERVFFPTRMIKSMFRNGVFLSIAAAILQGIGHVFRKPSGASPINPTFAATLDIVSALLLYTLLLMLSSRLKGYVRHYRTHMNPYFIVAGLLSAAGVLLFFSASSKIPVSQVSMIVSMQPVIVALLSGLLLSKLEHVTWLTIASSVLVTCGIVVISL